MVKGKEDTKRTMKHSCTAQFADILKKMKKSGYLIRCAPEVSHYWNHCNKIALRFRNFTLGITSRIPFACFVQALIKNT